MAYNKKKIKNNMLKNKDDIKEWLDKYGIEKYTIKENMTVDVHGEVNLSNKELTSIVVQFDYVKGNFYCYNNELISLEGCPKLVGGDFLVIIIN